MNKKIIIAIVTIFGLARLSLTPSPTYAEDEIITGTVTLDDETGDVTVTNTAANETNTANDNETSSCLDENGDLIPDCGVIDHTEPTDAELENAIDNGLADEPEVVCASTDEPGCEETPDEVDPETWPLIISLAALGGTVVLVFIINLFGRKK